MTYWNRPLGMALALIMILMAFEVALKKPICTDSMVVQKIDIVTGDSSQLNTQTIPIYNCENWQVSSPDFQAERLFHQLEPRLKKLEFSLGQLVKSRPIRLVLSVDKQDSFEVTESEVVLGTNQINSSQLEYAIAKSLLKQKIRTDADQSSLYFDALAALMVNHRVPNNSWSEQIWSDYDKLTFLQKLEFKNNLKSDILKIQKAPIFKLNAELDLLIEIDQPDRLELSELKKQIRNQHGLKAAIKTSTGLYVLPFMNPISEEEINKYRIHSKIIFADEKLLARSVKPLVAHAERILAISVRKETDLKAIDWRPLVELNFEKFWSRHLQFKMIQMHGPSFQYAAKKRNSDLKFAELFNAAFTRQFGIKSLGWGSSDWKKDIKAFKPIAQVDAIQLYRL